MSINKFALIRYQTIDRCLQNRFRQWTLEDLMEACSDALYEYEGSERGVSRRTIQLDLQTMRSEKLGYNAPIEVVDKKYYVYSDRTYSITNIPLTDQDMQTLGEVVDVLRQFKGFAYFSELTGMITRLEDKLYRTQHAGRSYIDFEKNELLRGLSWIDPLHKAIQKQVPLRITYQSFKVKEAHTGIYHPYLLKEYRNRWFVLCAPPKGQKLLLLALDRMQQVDEAPEVPLKPAPVDVFHFFDDAIGVTKMPNQRPQTIVLRTSPLNAPYLLTKPLHSSQQLLKVEDGGFHLFSIQVVWNFEVEREILGFGEGMEVLAPRRLREVIANRLKRAADIYTEVQKI